MATKEEQRVLDAAIAFFIAYTTPQRTNDAIRKTHMDLLEELRDFAPAVEARNAVFPRNDP